VQCVVFGVFALIGGAFLWAGLVIGDWRRIVFGVSVAVAWPFDTFVWSRIKMRVDERLYRWFANERGRHRPTSLTVP
jgi:hypothetical protein